MARDIETQFKELIAERKRVLLVFRKHGDGDSIGSAVALALFLKKLGKEVDIISDCFEPRNGFGFLTDLQTIHAHANHLQKFTLSIDVKDVGVESLSYDIQNEKLRIVIMPKSGFLTRDRVRTAQSEFLYDAIIVLDTADLHALGGLYEENTELFFTTPLVNIDHHPANEHFGQINLVDLTKSTTAEVIFELMQKIGDEYIDESIATALLTGIIAKTRSFKNDATKPTTLEHASALVALGADREKIVQHLFRTRTISALKLWGAALSHLKHDRERHLVWSTLTREDFARTGAMEHELVDVIDELISNSPDAGITVLMHEHETTDGNGVHVLIKTDKHYRAKQLLQPFNPTGDDRLVSCVLKDKTLQEAENLIIDHVKKSLPIA